MKRKYGLVGYPLGHSFSRSFFQQKFEDEHINATYENFEIQDISCLRQLISDNHELCGLNVTIPHKTTVIPLLDELHPLAREIGAVNVIKITRQGDKIFLKGFNSDIIGFTNSIAPFTRSRFCSKSTSTFRATATWPSASGGCWASTSLKTSTTPIFQRASRSSGAGGTCRLARGSATTSISLSAAAGRARRVSC